MIFITLGIFKKKLTKAMIAETAKLMEHRFRETGIRNWLFVGHSADTILSS